MPPKRRHELRRLRAEVYLSQILWRERASTFCLASWWCAVNHISAIVCFAVPESQVDMLIEATMGTPSEPGRWVVFGADMNLLSALDKQWTQSIDLVLAMLPGTSADVQEAALTILEHEGVLLSESVWVRGPDVPGSAPEGMLATFDALGPGVTELVSAFSDLVD